ncbi:hypothetical protein AUP68_03981 [Ilyonectria robusta]
MHIVDRTRSIRRTDQRWLGESEFGGVVTLYRRTATNTEQWKFASAILYDATFYFPRFSLLAFYNQLFPVSEPNLRRCLYFVAAFTVCAFLQAIFTDLFWCGANIAENW